MERQCFKALSKIYPLLPLQIFKLRYKMESIKRSIDNDKSKLTKAILAAKEMAEIVAKEGKELYDKGEIDGEDLHIFIKYKINCRSGKDIKKAVLQGI